MKTSEKTTTTDKKIPLFALLSGILIAYAITCVFFIVCALLLRYTSLNEENVPLIVSVACVVSVAVSGFDAARAAGEKGWLWGLVSGGIYAVILMVIGAIVIKGYRIDLRGFTLMSLSVAGGGLGGIIGVNFKKKRN